MVSIHRIHVWQQRSDETAPGAVTWSFFVTPTPKHTYLNLVELSELSRGKARVFTRQKFSFMQYRFDWRRRLVLSNVGGDIFSKAVKFYWKPPGLKLFSSQCA